MRSFHLELLPSFDPVLGALVSRVISSEERICLHLLHLVRVKMSDFTLAEVSVDSRRAKMGVRPFPDSLGGTTRKFVGIESDTPKKYDPLITGLRLTLAESNDWARCVCVRERDTSNVKVSSESRPR